jgi:hypothetical protein
MAKFICSREVGDALVPLAHTVARITPLNIYAIGLSFTALVD